MCGTFCKPEMNFAVILVVLFVSEKYVTFHITHGVYQHLCKVYYRYMYLKTGWGKKIYIHIYIDMNKEKNDPHLLFWGSFEETLLCIFSSKSEKNLVLASEYHVNWGLAVTYIVMHWQWLATWPVTSHYEKQWRLIISYTLRNILQWNLIPNTKDFIQQINLTLQGWF